MSLIESSRFNPDLSNIPRRESVSTMSFRFNNRHKENEEKKDKENEILTILRKLQSENWTRDKRDEEMKKEIRSLKNVIDNILDINLELVIEIKENINNNENTRTRNVIAITMGALN